MQELGEREKNKVKTLAVIFKENEKSAHENPPKKIVSKVAKLKTLPSPPPDN